MIRFFCFFFIGTALYGQNLQPQTAEQADIEVSYSSFEDLEAKPLNREIIFLFPDSVQHLVRKHLNQHGALNNLEELLQIPTIDIQILRQIKKSYSFHKKESFLSGTNNKHSFRHIFQTTTKPFLYNSLKSLTNLSSFRYKVGESLRIDLILENDAYETTHIKPDFISFSAEIKQFSIFRNIIFGDYNIRFGQGQVIWSGFRPFLYDDIFSAFKSSPPIKTHSSRVEYDFQRGLAFETQKFQNFNLVGAISHRKLDASLSDGKYIRSIIRTGIHVSESEIERKQSLDETLFSTQLKYENKSFNAGVLYHHAKYSKPFLEDSLKRQQKFISLYTDFNISFLKFSGEVSKHIGGGKMLNIGTTATPNRALSFAIYHFQYPKNYLNINRFDFQGNTIRQGKGYYLGFEFSPKREYKFISYLISTSQGEYSNFLGERQRLLWISKFQYEKRKKYLLYARLRIRQDEEQQPAEKTFTTSQKTTSYFRLNGTFDVNFTTRLSSRIEASNSKKQFGFVGYLGIKKKLPKIRSSLYFRASYFNIKDYNLRIYSYENDLQYNFSTFAHYGNGIKINTIFYLKFGKKIRIGAHYRSVYFLSKGEKRDLYEDLFKFQTKIQF